MRLLPVLLASFGIAAAAGAAPQVEAPDLEVEQVVAGLSGPTTLGFIGASDFLVLERTQGRVRRVTNGVLSATIALDLDVSGCSQADGDGQDDERGLLGIAIHPDFAMNRYVYLFYTESTGAGDVCDMFMATTSRIERYEWNPTSGLLETPTFIKGVPSFVYYHNGGIVDFGPDGKLYFVNGDNEGNGPTQNIGGFFDDTGVIFRLNDDGSVPTDNPFDANDDGLDPEDQYFAYGIRNCFGLGWDPVSGDLWDTENGPSEYDEINHVTPGFNSGWRAIMGPDVRDPQGTGDLLDLGAASTYADPAFSWLDPVAVTGIEFGGSALGGDYLNHLFVGDFNNGDVLHFEPNAGRDGLVLSGGLADEVADSANERDSLRVASGFNGIADLETGPDGALYVVSLGDGAVYRISGGGGGPAHDLSFTSLKPPKKVTFAPDPPAPRPLKASLQSQGSATETIANQGQLDDLLDVTISSLGGCVTPGVTVLPPKNGFPVVVAPNKKLSLELVVSWECINDELATTKDVDHADYTLEVSADLAALGQTDEDGSDDACPRAPAGDDKGCGKTGGQPFRVDLVLD